MGQQKAFRVGDIVEHRIDKHTYVVRSVSDDGMSWGCRVGEPFLFYQGEYQVIGHFEFSDLDRCGESWCFKRKDGSWIYGEVEFEPTELDEAAPYFTTEVIEGEWWTPEHCVENPSSFLIPCSCRGYCENSDCCEVRPFIGGRNVCPACPLHGDDGTQRIFIRRYNQ